MQTALFRLFQGLTGAKIGADGRSSLVSLPADAQLQTTGREGLAPGFVEVEFNRELFLVFQKDLLERSKGHSRCAGS